MAEANLTRTASIQGLAFDRVHPNFRKRNRSERHIYNPITFDNLHQYIFEVSKARPETFDTRVCFRNC
jgi:hypothetical protein